MIGCHGPRLPHGASIARSLAELVAPMRTDRDPKPSMGRGRRTSISSVTATPPGPRVRRPGFPFRRSRRAERARRGRRRRRPLPRRAQQAVRPRRSTHRGSNSGLRPLVRIEAFAPNRLARFRFDVADRLHNSQARRGENRPSAAIHTLWINTFHMWINPVAEKVRYPKRCVKRHRPSKRRRLTT